MKQMFRKLPPDRAMVALSLGSLAGGLVQILVRLSEPQVIAIDLFDWFVIAILTVEFVLGFVASHSKGSYLKSFPALLSLSIISLALLGAFFSLPILFSAPLLRLVRLLKFSGEAGRSSTELSQIPETL